MYRVFIIISFVVLSASCTQFEVYEKNNVIAGAKWNNNYIPTNTFTISDTSSSYDIYVVLRHTDYYKYNNIWLELTLKQPVDSAITQKVELTLANDALGTWEGTGISDIWEVRKRITANWTFKHKGTYIFSLKQIMRDNPLPGILNAGIRIEKVGSKN